MIDLDFPDLHAACRFFDSQEVLVRSVSPIPKALEFMNAQNVAREILWLGGNRTRKTSSVSWQLAFHLTGVYPEWWTGYRYDRPINAFAATVVWDKVRDVLQAFLIEGDRGKGVPPAIHETLINAEKSIKSAVKGLYDTLSIKHASGGYSALKFGSFQQGSYKWQSTSYDIVFLDEVPEYSHYVEARMRTAAFGDYKTFMFLTMWPDAYKVDFIERFIGDASPSEVTGNKYYFHSSWADNPTLSEEEKERLRQDMDPFERQAREFGIPVLGRGHVFMFNEKEVIVDPFKTPSHFALVYGLDPSSTSGGTWGSVLLAIDKDDGQEGCVYIIKDYKKSGLTPLEHADSLHNLYPTNWAMGVIDPAGSGENMHTKEKTFDFLVSRAGLQLSKAIKTKGSKEAIIDEIQKRLRYGKFKIFNTCTHLISELRKYVRDDKGMIVKKDDHCIDAMFYGMSGLHYAQTESRSARNWAAENHLMPQLTASFFG